MISKLEDKKVITYGLSVNADVRATNIIYQNGCMNFDLSISKKFNIKQKIHKLQFSMIGIHNIQNALAAISLGLELNIDINNIRHALKTFSGVQRRFQKVGNYKETIIIDDYGHHPVEIDSALSAARLLAPKNKIISIFQPHRYSRLKDLFHDFCSCFNDADKVLLLDVYPAGEDIINGFESKNLEEGLIKYGHKDVSYIENPQKLANLLLRIINPGDVVIFLGAGTVTKIANKMEQDLNNENR